MRGIGGSTAKVLGLKILEMILLQADEVIRRNDDSL